MTRLCRAFGDQRTRVTARLLAVPRYGYTEFFMFGSTKCPRCSSVDTVKIVYGAVTPRRQLQAAAGRIYTLGWVPQQSGEAQQALQNVRQRIGDGPQQGDAQYRSPGA
jgi:hypothetical protein